MRYHISHSVTDNSILLSRGPHNLPDHPITGTHSRTKSNPRASITNQPHPPDPRFEKCGTVSQKQQKRHSFSEPSISIPLLQPHSQPIHSQSASSPRIINLSFPRFRSTLSLSYATPTHDNSPGNHNLSYPDPCIPCPLIPDPARIRCPSSVSPSYPRVTTHPKYPMPPGPRQPPRQPDEAK